MKALLAHPLHYIKDELQQQHHGHIQPLADAHLPSLSAREYLTFRHVGALSSLGRDGRDQLPPFVTQSIFHPDALSDAPFSLSRMYVTILEYPASRANLAEAP